MKSYLLTILLLFSYSSAWPNIIHQALASASYGAAVGLAANVASNPKNSIKQNLIGCGGALLAYQLAQFWLDQDVKDKAAQPVQPIQTFFVAPGFLPLQKINARPLMQISAHDASQFKAEAAKLYPNDPDPLAKAYSYLEVLQQKVIKIRAELLNLIEQAKVDIRPQDIFDATALLEQIQIRMNHLKN